MSEHTINGWTFRIRDDPEKPAPWVYENVKNYGYNFATELSIEKIIVEVEEDGKATPRSLKFSDFEAVFSEQPAGFLKYDLKTRGYSISVANFSVYQGNGMLLDLVTKKGVLPPGKDAEGKPVDEPLYLFFTTLFGDYGNDPPHEFTGALQAARFTPALRFETQNKSVQSIRVHYRFHFDLDSYLQDAPELTKVAAEARQKMWGIENYASLIRDADHFPPSVLATIKLLKEVFGLQAELKFFDSQLDACKFESSCRFQTRLELEISNAVAPTNNILNISFRDPRTSLTDASKALKKTSVSLVDEKVGVLSVASSAEYNQPVVDELAAKVFEAIVGSAKPAQGLDTFAGQIGVVFAGDPLPGVSAECLNSNIKYCLIQLVIRNYPRRRAASIARQLQAVREKMDSDLADILKYLEPGEFEKVLEDIESLVGAMSLAFIPVAGPVILFWRIAEIVESISKLAGKLISIASFDAAEKPVLFEVIGTYVKKGDVTDTWDNLHWWGTEEIPSAPGAFYAVHSHYRWSQLNTYPTAEEAEPLDALNAILGTKQKLPFAAPQLRSLVKKFAANKLSGPLIDPAIPNQTISLALALNGGCLDKKLKESDEPFDMVSDYAPQEIATVQDSGNSGKDIVYWLACTAVRTQEDEFRGTLLVNGFYFAHDEEKPFSLFQPSNLFAATHGVDLQKPKREKPYQLFRRPVG